MMKSAYQLAMEKLEQQAPSGNRTLSDSQKNALQETEKKFQAKFAEREIFLNQTLQKATLEGNGLEVEKIKRQLIDEKAMIEEEKEQEKEKIRNAF